MTKTIDDLKTAFAGESKANRKYTAFAEKADEEGKKQVARLFRATAQAETVHALREFRVLGEVKTTRENLEAAIAGETYEFQTMYPEFIKDATAEANLPAQKAFDRAMEAEKVHASLYGEALKTLDGAEESFDYYVCPSCGYIHPRNAPERCPICNTPADRFMRVS